MGTRSGTASTRPSRKQQVLPSGRRPRRRSSRLRRSAATPLPARPAIRTSRPSASNSSASPRLWNRAAPSPNWWWRKASSEILDKERADQKKSGIDNFAHAIDLDDKDELRAGHRLTGFANDPTAAELPDQQAASIRAPADPALDPKGVPGADRGDAEPTRPESEGPGSRPASRCAPPGAG